jgi:hypothetical protein
MTEVRVSRYHRNNGYNNLLNSSKPEKLLLHAQNNMRCEPAYREQMQMGHMIRLIHVSDHEDRIAIKNTNGSTLNWKIHPGQVVYEGPSTGWLRIDPMEGKLKSREHTLITIRVEAANLDPGLYSAVIPIGTNFGIKKISLVMLIPFESSEGSNVRRSHIISDTYEKFS